MGYKLGVATGSNKKQAEEMLSALALRQYFMEIVSGEEVNKGKPDPEPFVKLLRKLNAERNLALVIENAPLGIQSAKAAGLACLAVASNNPVEGLREADIVFDNLSNMQIFFEKEYQLTSGKGGWKVDGRLNL
jgi:beta-phosphoglucomutase